MSGSNDVFDVPPEQLRETMSAVLSAIQQSGSLSGQCNNLVNEVVGSGAFKGPAASAALVTASQINDDMLKILQHGTALAEHLGNTASVVEEGEGHAASKLHGVAGTSSSVLS